MELDVKNVPPFTPKGQQMFDATKSDIPTTNSKDGMLICDPLGYPRLFAYNYGFSFVQLPDRVVQFFEWGHTFRDIWTDGRKLPEDPPELHWLGWNVGHWEGDTFVIESNGYDERSWITQSNPDGGWTHSDELKVVHSGRELCPLVMYRLPVNLAGASGRIGGAKFDLPSTCSCQLPSAEEALGGCLLGTRALA